METGNRSVWFRLLSALLQYPDDALLRRLADMEAEAETLSSTESRAAIDAFLSYLKKTPPIRLRENYTAIFDMNPATTLNLTWHVYGDSEKRADALAGLQRVYDGAGWERITGELPDYLPLMLEFLSICPEPKDTGRIRDALNGIHPLIKRLESTAPAYVALIRSIAGMAKKHRGQEEISGSSPVGEEVRGRET